MVRPKLRNAWFHLSFDQTRGNADYSKLCVYKCACCRRGTLRLIVYAIARENVSGSGILSSDLLQDFKIAHYAHAVADNAAMVFQKHERDVYFWPAGPDEQCQFSL
jgi:hypothetical protein